MRKTPKHIRSGKTRRNMSPRTIRYNGPAELAMIDAGVTPVADMLNNVGRHCDIPVRIRTTLSGTGTRQGTVSCP